MDERDFIVIGSGPAGLAAAITAAKVGLRVTVIGEDATIGGQIFRQLMPPLKFHERGFDIQEEKIFMKLRNEWEQLNIQFFNKAIVWAVFDDKVVALNNPEYSLLKTKRLLISEGAYETPVAFPGWTLPGVMTLGAIQTLLKGQGVVPAGKIVVAGTGPLLYYTASQLLNNGAYVKGIIEAASFAQVSSWAGRLWRAPGILAKGFKYIATIKKNRIPIYFSSVVKEARGDERLREIEYVKVNHLWKPETGTEQRMKADVLCMNFGFTPSTQLSHMVGCAHSCDSKVRGWIPIFNSSFETTQGGVFVAGDGTGIGGAKIAILQGRIVATEVARQLGAIKDIEAASLFGRLKRQISHHRWYQNFLNKIYSFRPGLLDLLTDDTLICRCEEVNYRMVSDAIKKGSASIEQIKRLTRIGMGKCQGRFCYPSLVGILSRIKTQEQLTREDFSARPPVRPIPLGELFKIP